jgi:hypothetical protein
MGTGTGAQSIETAARAGYEGGKAGEEFQKNLRGQGPMREVVDDARKAVGQMRQERGAEYRAAMTKVGADKTILSWNDVDTALADMDKVATFKGQSLSPSTAAIRDSIKEEVEAWKNLQASEFGTAEGFDALKRRVGDIRDSTQYGTPERHVADQAYNAIRSTIVKQVPAYGKIMQGYEEASDIIREMEKTLSLNPTATIDTALRKLQSVLRNNVNTSYGRRAELMDFLTRAGAPHLMEKLSGQALNTWTPRGGFGKLLMGGAAGSALAHPAAAAAIPLMSPRAVGEGAYYAGKAASKLPARQIRRAVEPARQVGRATDYLDNPGDSSDALDNARP